ncbi:hypothetical protein ACP275_04G105800 [Erythranthe tilingii]
MDYCYYESNWIHNKWYQSSSILGRFPRFLEKQSDFNEKVRADISQIRLETSEQNHITARIQSMGGLVEAVRGDKEKGNGEDSVTTEHKVFDEMAEPKSVAMKSGSSSTNPLMIPEPIKPPSETGIPPSPSRNIDHINVKLEFPKFYSQFPRTWLRRCHKYFATNPMAMCDQVKMLVASMELEGRVDDSYINYIQRLHYVEWEAFSNTFLERHLKQEEINLVDEFSNLNPHNSREEVLVKEAMEIEDANMLDEMTKLNSKVFTNGEEEYLVADIVGYSEENIVVDEGWLSKDATNDELVNKETHAREDAVAVERWELSETIIKDELLMEAILIEGCHMFEEMTKPKVERNMFDETTKSKLEPSAGEEIKGCADDKFQVICLEMGELGGKVWNVSLTNFESHEVIYLKNLFQANILKFGKPWRMPPEPPPLHYQEKLYYISTFLEIGSLFAALLSRLQIQHPTTNNKKDYFISFLNRSLNLREAPRVRVLETALSLTYFIAPQVLRVGGQILGRDCGRVLEMCADILMKCDWHKRNLPGLLLHNVIRMAALAPCFQHTLPSMYDLDVKFNDSSSSTLANLVGQSTDEFTVKNGEIPLWLLLWHLNPMKLKQDLSEILQEIIKRPFLCLSVEIMYNMIERRFGTSLFYKAVPSSFVVVENIEDQSLENNKQAYWVPDLVKEKRFYDALENAKNWTIIRIRFWDTPLVLWISKSGKEIVVMDSTGKLETLPPAKVTNLKINAVNNITIGFLETGVSLQIEDELYSWFGDQIYGWPYTFISVPRPSPKLDRLPLSVVSNSQTYLFQKVKQVDISMRVEKVCVQEGVDFDLDALNVVVAQSDGPLHDVEMMIGRLCLLGKNNGVVFDDELLDLLHLALSFDVLNTIKRARELLRSMIYPMQLKAQLASLVVNFDFNGDLLLGCVGEAQNLNGGEWVSAEKDCHHYSFSDSNKRIPIVFFNEEECQLWNRLVIDFNTHGIYLSKLPRPPPEPPPEACR